MEDEGSTISEGGMGMLSAKALTALVFMIAGLLGVVVLTGLYQGSLDSTGIALALSSVITGLVTGALYKSRSESKNDGGKDQ